MSSSSARSSQLIVTMGACMAVDQGRKSANVLILGSKKSGKKAVMSGMCEIFGGARNISNFYTELWEWYG